MKFTYSTLPLVRLMVLTFMVLFFAECTKKRRDTPQLPNYYIGKWDVAEMYYYSGGNRVDYTNIKGKIKFDNGAVKSFHYSGTFDISYTSNHNGIAKDHSYQCDISWRIDGSNLKILTEDDENVVPCLGIGEVGMTNFRVELFKEDFIVLSTYRADIPRPYMKLIRK
jgi:hypothetical protein